MTVITGSTRSREKRIYENLLLEILLFKHLSPDEKQMMKKSIINNLIQKNIHEYIFKENQDVACIKEW
jgi:hypothetical protein